MALDTCFSSDVLRHQGRKRLGGIRLIVQNRPISAAVYCMRILRGPSSESFVNDGQDVVRCALHSFEEQVAENVWEVA